MQFLNTEHHFGVISILFYRLGAFGITIMLSASLIMTSTHSRGAYLPWMKFRSFVGILIMPLLVARIIWDFTVRQPDKISGNQALNRVANLVHGTLLVLVAIQLVNGLLHAASGSVPLRVFSWFVLPSVTGTAFKVGHSVLNYLHFHVSLAISVVVSPHLFGVFKHLLINDDDTLTRMIGMSGERASSRAE